MSTSTGELKKEVNNFCNYYSCTDSATMEKEEKIKEEETVYLRREVGLVSAVNFMLCFVLGTGIFVTPGNILASAGSVGMCITVWVTCGLISFLSCLPFGELSSVVPRSGGIYIYLLTAFKNWHPFFGGLPAFTFFFMMYMIILPCSISLCGILFADYTFVVVHVLLGDKPIANEELMKTVLSTICFVVIGTINCISVKLYVKTQDLLSYIKMAVIIFLILCGFYLYVTGKALKFDPGFEGSNISVTKVTEALFFGLYTYDGGCFITNITEEMKNPEKNILRSILIGLTITTLAYVLLNIAFLSALTPAEIASGTTVIAQFAIKLFGGIGGAVAGTVVCLSVLGGLMSGVFYASRMGYVAATEGHLPEFLCLIHGRRKTPAPAIVAQVSLSLMYFYIGGNSSTLIDMYAFFSWLAYGMTMITVFVFRKQLPDAKRSYRVPSIIPLIIMVLSFYLFVISILEGKPHIIFTTIACITLTTVTYYIFIYKALRFKIIGKLQVKLQNMLGLVLLTAEPTY